MRAVVVALAISACGGQPPATPSPASASPAASPSPSPEPSVSPEPSPSPEPEPGKMPRAFTADLEPSELPLDKLVPGGADATGQWFGFTANGVVVLVAWAEPGSDPFLLPRGFALWRRHASTPHWRVSLVERHDADEGIQEIQMSTTDLTGDGSDDALIFEGIGGSGACGSWLVLDLAREKETYGRELCDGRIDPGPPGSPGLVVTRSVFREGDAHCCPSAMRETTLAWTGRAWRVTGTKTIEA
jgi:hypothetical protein